jgi:hypothetical protein
MTRAKERKVLDFPVVEWRNLSGMQEADPRQGDCAARCHVQDLWPRRRSPLYVSYELHDHFLLNGVARLHLDRKWYGQRRAVRLERSVSPVPLVLGLEYIALETDFGVEPLVNLMAQRGNLQEWLMRGYGTWKRRSFR